MFWDGGGTGGTAMVCATSRSFKYELRNAAVVFAGVLVLMICALRERVVFVVSGPSTLNGDLLQGLQDLHSAHIVIVVE
jgi:hypothetical protein